MFALFDQRRDRWIRATDLRVKALCVALGDCVVLFQTKEQAELAAIKFASRKLQVVRMKTGEV